MLDNNIWHFNFNTWIGKKEVVSRRNQLISDSTRVIKIGHYLNTRNKGSLNLVFDNGGHLLSNLGFK